MSLPELDDQSLPRAIGESQSLPVLVMFVSQWCNTCAEMLPRLETLADESEKPLKAFQIDFDSNIDAAVAQRVMMVPTLIVFRHGAAVEKLTGSHPPEKLALLIRKHA